MIDDTDSNGCLAKSPRQMCYARSLPIGQQPAGQLGNSLLPDALIAARAGHLVTFGIDQSTCIPIDNVHRLENPGKLPLHLIEGQSGAHLGEDDVVHVSRRPFTMPVKIATTINSHPPKEHEHANRH